ncbi:MAG: hypothetical protein CL932_03390 [Deltaproteobacteria bacterium]|nr:hypothetical protein [Deltaproteobacteria bacterium]
MADLLRALYNIHLNKLTTLRLRLFPSLKPFERREGAERQGGEFVEAYVAKRTKQISHEEKPLQEEFCKW